MEVTIRLHDKEDLWGRFHKMRNEMIVTKTGRKMFPKLEFAVEGLEPEKHYGIVLQMEQVDDNRYKFQEGEWSPAGRGELAIAANPVYHHDGVMSGAQWMRSPIHFERLKITNNPSDSNPSHVFLHSMHKYVPVITVLEVQQYSQTANFITPNQSEVARRKFDETEFITVTAYQNEKTKALKIKYNPYAKGFREGGDRRKASPRSSPTETPTLVESKPFEVAQHMMSSLNMPPVNPFFLNPAAFFNPYLLMSPYRLPALQPLQKPFTM